VLRRFKNARYNFRAPCSFSRGLFLYPARLWWDVVTQRSAFRPESGRLPDMESNEDVSRSGYCEPARRFTIQHFPSEVGPLKQRSGPSWKYGT
jgi:hypothetical protein